MEQVNVDIIVIGGGIQGLWVLRELISPAHEGHGYSAVLFERADLISGQTAHSQAYIHKGHIFADEKRVVFLAGC